MTEYFVTLNGIRATSARVHVPWAGAWLADVDLDDEVALSGPATVRLGSLALSGTVLQAFSGGFELASAYRVVGGAGGWSKRVAGHHYHNDLGVRGRLVVNDLARAVGESIEPGSWGDQVVAVDFVRAPGPASRVLEQILGLTPWRVDYDGITRLGARPAVETPGSAFELLGFDVGRKVATLALDKPEGVVVGAVLRDRLRRPLSVRQIAIEITAGALRVRAWGKELS